MSVTRSRVPGSATSRSAWAGGELNGRRPVNDDRAHDALALAEAALAEALRTDVTEAEVLVMAEDSALTRFANSEIHQNVAETNVVINLRCVVGRRVGRTRRDSGTSPRVPRPSPGSWRSSRTGAASPDRPRPNRWPPPTVRRP